MVFRPVLTACALALLGVAAISPAQAEVVTQDERGFATQASAVVKAAPYAVWRQIMKPGEWWSDEHTWSGDSANMYISPQGSGCFCELLAEPGDMPEGVQRGSVEHMRVLLAQPPQALRMVGALGPLQSEPVTGVLTITLKPVGTGTRISWFYVVGGAMRFPVGEMAKAVDAVMNQQLAGLVARLGPVAAADREAGKGEPVKEPADKQAGAEKPDSATIKTETDVIDALDEMGSKRSTGTDRDDE